MIFSKAEDALVLAAKNDQNKALPTQQKEPIKAAKETREEAINEATQRTKNISKGSAFSRYFYEDVSQRYGSSHYVLRIWIKWIAWLWNMSSVLWTCIRCLWIQSLFFYEHGSRGYGFKSSFCEYGSWSFTTLLWIWIYIYMYRI